jgi:hypothetical protein
MNDYAPYAGYLYSNQTPMMLYTERYGTFLIMYAELREQNSEFDEIHTLLLRKNDDNQWQVECRLEYMGSPYIDIDEDGFPEFLSSVDYTDSGGHCFSAVYPKSEVISSIEYYIDFYGHTARDQ